VRTSTGRAVELTALQLSRWCPYKRGDGSFFWGPPVPLCQAGPRLRFGRAAVIRRKAEVYEATTVGVVSPMSS
jgi:hypothetical protein